MGQTDDWCSYISVLIWFACMYHWKWRSKNKNMQFL